MPPALRLTLHHPPTRPSICPPRSGGTWPECTSWPAGTWHSSSPTLCTPSLTCVARAHPRAQACLCMATTRASTCATPSPSSPRTSRPTMWRARWACPPLMRPCKAMHLLLSAPAPASPSDFLSLPCPCASPLPGLLATTLLHATTPPACCPLTPRSYAQEDIYSMFSLTDEDKIAITRLAKDPRIGGSHAWDVASLSSRAGLSHHQNGRARSTSQSGLAIMPHALPRPALRRCPWSCHSPANPFLNEAWSGSSIPAGCAQSRFAPCPLSDLSPAPMAVLRRRRAHHQVHGPLHLRPRVHQDRRGHGALWRAGVCARMCLCVCVCFVCMRVGACVCVCVNFAPVYLRSSSLPARVPACRAGEAPFPSIPAERGHQHAAAGRPWCGQVTGEEWAAASEKAGGGKEDGEQRPAPCACASQSHHGVGATPPHAPTLPAPSHTCVLIHPHPHPHPHHTHTHIYTHTHLHLHTHTHTHTTHTLRSSSSTWRRRPRARCTRRARARPRWASRPPSTATQ